VLNYRDKFVTVIVNIIAAAVVARPI